MPGLSKFVNSALDRATDAPLTNGGLAPEFTLPNQKGAPITLSALRGSPVVLVFYPRDHTSICSMQLRDFHLAADTLAPLGVRVFGVNAGSARTHASFCEKLGLGFDLLVDDGAVVSRKYRATFGPVNQVRRTVYGIDAAGLIVFGERGTPTPAAVIAALGTQPPTGSGA